MTSRPPATKRATASSSAIPAARPPCNIHPTAVISDKALLTGTFSVEIGANAILHPYARIRAEGGRVVIGAGCTIAEEAIIGLPAGQTGEVVLDRAVNVDSSAEVLASHVGEGTEVGVMAKIGARATVGRFCRLAATEVVGEDEEVADYIVVFGDGKRRLDRTLVQSDDVRAARVKNQERHVEVLKKLIPDAKAKWAS